MGRLFMFTRCWSIQLAVMLLIISPASYASLEEGINWLEQQQQLDGSFYTPGTLATRAQSTSEAVHTLSLASSLNPIQKLAATNYLRAEPYDNLESLVRRIFITKSNDENFSAELELLDNYKTAVGGYGDYKGYEESIIATVTALQALAQSEALTSTATSKAISYLLAAQRNDKGWAEEGNYSSVFVTAVVSRTLQAYRFNYNLSGVINNATEYLLNAQEDEGGWATNMDTAIALLAVSPTTTDITRYQKALEKLRNAQSPHGSWNNDIYTTAFALQLFQFLKNAPTADGVVNGAINGTVVNATTKLPLEAVQVSISGPSNVLTMTDSNGYFKTTKLLPGNYTVTIHFPGFFDVIKTVALVTGSYVDLGLIELAVPLNKALIHGQVVDSVTHLPLAGVSIDVFGSAQWQTQTDDLGRYVVEVLPGSTKVTVSYEGYHSAYGLFNAALSESIDFSVGLKGIDIPSPTIPELRGKVADSETNQPLANVRISIESSTFVTLSDADGSFNISGLSEGELNVFIEKEGYKTINLAGVITPGSVVETGILRMEPISTTEATISGHISDALSREPLAGVSINISGTVNSQVITDQNGNFTINTSPGAIQLEITHEGYYPVTGSLNALVGREYNFSPALQSTDIEPAAEILLRGQVMDNTSGFPIEGVQVNIKSTTLTALSNSQGYFEIAGLSEGHLEVTVEHPNYLPLTFEGAAIANSIIEMGELRLQPKPQEMYNLYGRVLDADTGNIIPNAVISVPPHTATSNVLGQYEFNGLIEKQFSLAVSASGYQSITYQMSLSASGRSEFDVLLQKERMGLVTLSALDAAKPMYKAYEMAVFNGGLHNEGTTAGTVFIQTQIFNSAGTMIDEFAVSPEGIAGLESFVLASGERKTFDFSWATEFYEPGYYKVLVSIYDAQTIQILDQQHSVLELQASAVLESVRLLVVPNSVNQGIAVPLKIQAALRNKSNIQHAFTVKFHLTDSSGSLLYEGETPITLEPNQRFATVELDNMERIFSLSGRYDLVIDAIDGVVPEYQEAGSLNVIPNINIDIEQSISPAQVVPGDIERVRVKIRLEGTEVQ